MACLVRVPVELAKQRRQVLAQKSALAILISECKRNGICNGMYKGFRSTIAREIPFSCIQFPLWEYLKQSWGNVSGAPLSTTNVAFCGAIAGGVAAALTTPLDVIKTRVALSEDSIQKQPSFVEMTKIIFRSTGLRG